MATSAEDVWQILERLATAQERLTASQEELSVALAELAVAQKETEQQQKETSSQQKETDRQLKETSNQQKETDRQLKELGKQTKELGKQIGGLGAKFGSFTEGLALPSMETILQQQFGMEVISPRVRVTKHGQHIELDVLAYANGENNRAYIVEVKSHPREEAIAQLKNILQRFKLFFPEHQDKQVYGILAAVDLSSDLREKVLQEGFYVARIHDQVFEMDTPEYFQPREW